MYADIEALLSHAQLNILGCNIIRRIDMPRQVRKHFFYVTSYHKSGYAKLRIFNKTHLIPPGTVVHIPPNVEFEHYKDDPGETLFLWWHYTFRIADVVDVMNFVNIPLMFQLPDPDYFEHVFLDFVESFKRPKHPFSFLLKKAKEYELLYILLNNTLEWRNSIANEASPQQASFVNVLVNIVKQPEQPLSLKKLSEELHMHPTYISNRFKELFGKSPLLIHKEMKIKKAQSLLESTEESIQEISERMGFNSVQSFSRLFKLYVGMSPSQFREMNRRWK